MSTSENTTVKTESDDSNDTKPVFKRKKRKQLRQRTLSENSDSENDLDEVK